MAFNKKIGRGSLSKSKKESNGGPEYIGSIKLDESVGPGDKVWLAAWVKQGDDGKYFSIVVETPAEQQRQAPVRVESGNYGNRQPARQAMDDEIPFLPEFR